MGTHPQPAWLLQPLLAHHEQTTAISLLQPQSGSRSPGVHSLLGPLDLTVLKAAPGASLPSDHPPCSPCSAHTFVMCPFMPDPPLHPPLLSPNSWVSHASPHHTVSLLQTVSLLRAGAKWYQQEQRAPSLLPE